MSLHSLTPPAEDRKKVTQLFQLNIDNIKNDRLCHKEELEVVSPLDGSEPSLAETVEAASLKTETDHKRHSPAIKHHLTTQVLIYKYFPATFRNSAHSDGRTCTTIKTYVVFMSSFEQQQFQLRPSSLRIFYGLSYCMFLIITSRGLPVPLHKICYITISTRYQRLSVAACYHILQNNLTKTAHANVSQHVQHRCSVLLQRGQCQLGGEITLKYLTAHTRDKYLPSWLCLQGFYVSFAVMAFH